MTTNENPAAVRVCAIADIQCSRGCGTGECKREAESLQPAAAPIAQDVQWEAALAEAVELTIETLGRQLDLIAERAPANYLDKVPVVRSLTAHKKRLERALAERNASFDVKADCPKRTDIERLRDDAQNCIDSGVKWMTITERPDAIAELAKLALLALATPNVEPAPSPADERAAFEYDDVVSICDAHGIGLPVDCVEMVVDIVKLSGLLAARAASANETGADVSGAYTYSSVQATNCARCGNYKHTPLRIDWMGGYVCLTCIDRELESRSPAMAPVAWKTTHPAVCVPITEDREIAEQWRAHGYQVIEFFDRPVFAMAAEAVAIPAGWKAMPPSATTAMRMAMAKAAAEYMRRTGGNSPDAIYEAGFAAAPQPAHADARVGLTADQREAILMAIGWHQYGSSVRDVKYAEALRALLQGANQ